MTKKAITVAICTFNRGKRLPELVCRLREQECPIPFDILFVDNNSTDDTAEILERLAREPGASLRYVRENRQGITYARNRALSECMESSFMMFIDDDEIPRPGMLAAAVHALDQEGADCAGGRVEVVFQPGRRPRWLSDDLLKSLAEIDYGSQPFWITEKSTPVWTANIAYRTEIFSMNPELRFDRRYNRQGKAIGGGSDAIMFRQMVDKGVRIRYRPDMVVGHYVEQWRLKRTYFLKLHFVVGLRFALNEMPDYPRQMLGIPPFLITNVLRQFSNLMKMWLRNDAGAMRQAMNVAHAVGQVVGRLYRLWA